jgi:hypothetical protein
MLNRFIKAEPVLLGLLGCAWVAVLWWLRDYYGSYSRNPVQWVSWLFLFGSATAGSLLCCMARSVDTAWQWYWRISALFAAAIAVAAMFWRDPAFALLVSAAGGVAHYLGAVVSDIAVSFVTWFVPEEPSQEELDSLLDEPQ